MKKLLKYLYLKRINVIIYSMCKENFIKLPLDYELKITKPSVNKTKFEILHESTVIHESTVFNRLYFLKLIDKVGPAIGDCITHKDYRGQSIYPKVINNITHKLLFKNNHEEVFVIVEHDNHNSIRGIEKAGFKIHSRVETSRFLLFYLNIKVTH